MRFVGLVASMALVSGVSVVGGCDGGQDDGGEGEGEGEGGGETIVDIVVGSDDFDTLEAALTAAELTDLLSGEGPFTVFAPTDAAFDLLPAGVVDSLLADPTGALSDVLRYHVVPGAVDAATVVGLASATTANGELDIQLVGPTVVLDGRVQVTTTDIAASNGIIHIIDAVLVPGEFPGSIADAVAASPRFSTLLAAVGAADPAVFTALGGDGPLTLFAPPNTAFKELPAGTLDSLLLAENQDRLTKILLFHALGSEVPAAAVTDGAVLESLSGDDLTFAIGPGISVNDNNIQAFDITADNGVIHVVANVLFPPT
jgi:uncharacterized surface protein with fasciclin (FAS1) repeats